MMLMSKRTNNFSVLLTSKHLMMDIGLITGYVGVASDYTHVLLSTASKEFVVVRGCTIIYAYTSSIFHAAPGPTMDPTQLPLNQ